MSNRAERRRQERAMRKGEAVFQVKRSDLDKLYDEALRDVSEKTVPLVLYASLEVLRTKYGFGQKRLKAFAEHVFEIYDGLDRGYVGFDDIAEAIEKETGINLTATDEGSHVDTEGKKNGSKNRKSMRGLSSRNGVHGRELPESKRGDIHMR